MADLLEELKAKVSGWERKIVFPKAHDLRVFKAAGRLAAEEIMTPVLIGDMEDIQEKADELNISLDRIEIYDPARYAGIDEMAAAFVEQRKVTEPQAREMLLDGNYFGMMLIFLSKAHGLVSGDVNLDGIPSITPLDAPVNNLSYGYNEEDVYKLALITAVQSIGV